MRLLPLSLLSSTPLSAASPATADPWQAEVVARIRDGARAFHADGEVWKAASPETGMQGTFDLDGAWLAHEGARIGVRTARWGRAAAWEEASPTSLGLGACTFDQDDPEGACIRRLELESAGLRETWSSTRDGFEQGWSVEAPPLGSGDLLLDVAVEGASVEVGENELWLMGEDGHVWVVSGFSAWDVEGVPLPLGLEQTADGFRIRVDDATARYPVTVDPVYSTATLTSETANSYFGFSLSDAGDVNADGYDDVIVGALGYDSTSGRAYVYDGSASGLYTTATVTLDGEAAYDAFGWSVSSAGDVNADGFDDIVVGAWGYGDNQGRAYVHHGSTSGVVLTAVTTITGATAGDNLGSAASGACDVNGDGYDDVIVGARGYESRGAAYVYHGSSSGVSSTAETRLTGTEALSEFGASVSCAGDINGDGYDDVVVGAYGYSYSDYTGRAYLYEGSASGVSTRAATTLTGESVGDTLGGQVSGAGDVNGDGYDDIIVGAWGYGGFTGVAYVYHGSSGGLVSTAATTLTGETDGDDFGYAVSGAGDVNGDGYADVFVGAPGYGESTGRAYVYEGSASGVSTTASATFSGEVEGDQLGFFLSGAGDVNGDGYDDLIVGAWGYGESTGRAYVYCSNAETCGATAPLDTGDTAEPDTGPGDSGDPHTADFESSAGDSGDSEGGGSHTAGEPAEDDTDASPDADDLAKDPLSCGCATTDPTQGAPLLALLPLLARHRRSRSTPRARRPDTA